MSAIVIKVSASEIDAIMPMHVLVGRSGHVMSAGRTLRKLNGGEGLVGARFQELFRLRRPEARHGTVAELRAMGRSAVICELRHPPHTRFKGVMVSLSECGGVLVNLSLGLSALPAIQNAGLSNSDFAPTDQTIEMLYLREAKSAMDSELRKFAARLELSLDAAKVDAMTDQLTGLGNRRALEKRFEGFVRSGKSFSLLHLDLDYFKQVNDTMGHAAGDQVLLEVAVRLRRITRRHDMIARVGGDEFILLLGGKVSEARLNEISAQIIEQLEKPILFEGQDCRISGSIGYTWSTHYPHPDLAEMVADADTALYAAKNAGRGQAVRFDTALRENGGERRAQ